MISILINSINNERENIHYEVKNVIIFVLKLNTF